ncbi:hypothetical protein GOBAR_AA01097 [Gossypium barbadense]|uniref:Auxin efflux carrier component n=1 Tax=Gossypium barbadense TaxID=3634 RepID=A0A2P5YVC1_GOSBA|nr:hypothetical protein GOBAR_AA01097 [Gossypium barbadense]
MISLADVYHVIAATVPLYFAMILAYVSVKWWKLFTPEQCAGINKFVAKFSIPLLSFQVISENNPYKMNLKLILADFLQKLLAFLVLFALTKLSSRGGLSSIITDEEAPEEAQGKDAGEETQTRARKSKTMLIFLTVGKKLVANPNTHATLLLFMASRPSIIACGIRMAAVAMIMKFIAGPALMAAASTTLGLKGKLLRVAIVQAALPQGIVPFVFAKEYNVHPDILSTWNIKFPAIVGKSIAILSSGGLGMAMFSLVIFGMLIALPVALVYYLLLAL